MIVNSARTAAQMEQEIWTHHSPTQSRSPAHGRVRIGDIQYTLLDKIDNLTVKRRLEAVRDVANDLFADMNRFLANRFVERDCALDSFCRCFFTRHHFNERHDMGRIEGMSDDAAFGMLTGRLHGAHGQSGGTRSDNRVWPSRGIHVGEELILEILPFRSVLLHQVGIRERLLQVRCELQMIARRVG